MEDNSTPNNSAPTPAPEALQVDPAAQAEGNQVPATPAQREKLLKKYQLKIDGKVEDFELDINDDDAMKRHLQKAKAADKRMEEASMTKRQAEEFIRMLKTDPMAVLTNPKIGINFRQMAEEYLSKQIEEEMLSPQEKKVRQAEAILREKEEQEKTSKEKAEAERMKAIQDRYAADYDKKITAALSGANLPKSPSTVKRMAQLMSKNLEMGLDLEPKDLVEMVREDYVKEIQELFGASDEDTLLSIMGESTANKIRKADLKRLRSVGPQNAFTQSAARSAAKTEQKMTKDEWRERLEKIKSGK